MYQRLKMLHIMQRSSPIESQKQENVPNRGINPIIIMFDHLRERMEVRQSIVFDKLKISL